MFCILSAWYVLGVGPPSQGPAFSGLNIFLWLSFPFVTELFFFQVGKILLQRTLFSVDWTRKWKQCWSFIWGFTNQKQDRGVSGQDHLLCKLEFLAVGIMHNAGLPLNKLRKNANCFRLTTESSNLFLLSQLFRKFLHRVFLHFFPLFPAPRCCGCNQQFRSD